MVQPNSPSLRQYLPCTTYLFTPPSGKRNLEGTLDRIFKVFFAATLIWDLFFVIKCTLILDCVVTVLRFFVDSDENGSVASSRRPSLPGNHSSRNNSLRFSRTSSQTSFPSLNSDPLRRSEPSQIPSPGHLEDLDTGEISPLRGEPSAGFDDLLETNEPVIDPNAREMDLQPYDLDTGEEEPAQSAKTHSSSSSESGSVSFNSDSSFPMSDPLTEDGSGIGYLRRGGEELASAAGSHDDGISDSYSMINEREGQSTPSGAFYVMTKVYEYLFKP
jgi:hypothetical protein